MDTYEDYTEADRYDWDQSDESQYCQHGTFIGSWWGPDILCQYCEDGVTAEEYAEIVRQMKHDHLVRAATSKLWDDVFTSVYTFRDKVHRNPQGLSDWFGDLIDEVKACDNDTLSRYLEMAG